MLLFNARNNNQGFTMVEILVVIIIVGILSAITAPSFLGMLNRNKVNNALAQVQGAFKEAQREAIRKSKSCTVNINTTTKNITGTPSDCLVTGNRQLEGIAIRSSNSSIPFTFKGNVNVSTNNTIVIALPDGTVTKQKCLVIASGIGIMRTGDYDDSDTTGTDDNKCTTFQ